MAFDLALVETRLNLLSWRDTQLESITDQLERNLPALMSAIERHVDEMAVWEVAKAHINIKPSAEAVIAPWAEEQSRIAVERALEGLSGLLETVRNDSDLGRHVRTALPAVAGVGLIAASVFAIPAVVSFATVTSTWLLIFTTSTISQPLLLAGGTALAVMSLTGSQVLRKANLRTRAHLVERLQNHALTAVLGYGLAPEARCLLSDLQAAVLKAGQNALEEAC